MYAEIEIKHYAEKIDNAKKGEWVKVPSEILGKVLEASSEPRLDVFMSDEPGFFDVKVYEK